MRKSAVSVRWTENLQFVGTDSGKHSVVISSHDEKNHTGLRPLDMLLLALGACSAYDVVTILQKKRANLTGLKVAITGEQKADIPRAFRHIHLDYELRGGRLTEAGVRQAIELSLQKYCSVAATVSGRAEITHTFTMKAD
jgi:putative redox protein